MGVEVDEGTRGCDHCPRPDTSVVHGMPGEAIKLGGATYVLSPEKIRMALTSLATHNR